MLAGGLGEGLVGALDDSLRGDVDPGAGGHLAVHRQPGALQLAELLPGGPVRHQVGVGDQHPWAVARRAQDADRLARLDQQRLVVGQAAELVDDGVEGLPAARRATGAAVHDQVVRILGDLGVEVVHEHPQRRLLLPAAAGQLGATGRAAGAWAAPRFDGRHGPMISRPQLALVTDSRKAIAKPSTVVRPTVSPPPSKASGIIVSASMVRMAPPAKAWTKPTTAGSMPASTPLPTPAAMAEATATPTQRVMTNR